MCVCVCVYDLAVLAARSSKILPALAFAQAGLSHQLGSTHSVNRLLVPAAYLLYEAFCWQSPGQEC